MNRQGEAAFCVWTRRRNGLHSRQAEAGRYPAGKLASWHRIRPGFFDELKRRHVVRVAIAYALTGWLIVQIATQVFPFFDILGWAVRLIVILIVIGFPVAVAVALAWVYELTPEGIRRTEAADAPEARSEYAQRDVGRKLNAVIIAVLVLAVALLGWRLYAVRYQPPSTAKLAPSSPAAKPVASAKTVALAVPARNIPEKSVAVLPFANESGDRDQQFFSDGLSEDLPPGAWHNVAVALALQIGTDHAAADGALRKVITEQAGAAAYQIAEVYALRKDPDNLFKWLDRAWSIRDPGIGYLLFDPLILRYKGDPRFAAFCKKVGLPTTTDAVAMK